MKTITASVRYDDKCKLWYIKHCDMPGITTEAETIDDLSAKLPELIRGLTEANGDLVTEEIQIKVTVFLATRVQKSEIAGIKYQHPLQMDGGGWG